MDDENIIATGLSSARIVVDRRTLNGFRRRAWRAFPNEHIEVLIGREGEIHAIHPIDYLSTRSMCVYDDEQFEIVRKQVHPLQLLGTIHTHPNIDTCEPSEHDWIALRQWPERVTGIACLYTTGKRRRSRVQFYRAIAPFHLDVR